MGRIGMLAGLALATAGCGQPSSWPFGSTATADTADLASRPALPEITVRYERMMRDLRAALSGQLGAEGWGTEPPTAPAALCQDFGTEPDTGIRVLPITTYHKFVARPTWDRAAATIGRIARPYGFDRSVRVVDRPHEHRLDLYDHYGASLNVQDGPEMLAIGLVTGCHLRTSPSPRSSRAS